MVKRAVIVGVVLLVLLASAFAGLWLGAQGVGAQSPIATPTPEVTPAPEPEPVGLPENPTDVISWLGWLAGGGAGAFVAVWIEKRPWFQRVKPEHKRLVVLAAVGIVALIPQIVSDVVPAGVWEFIQPYFATVVAAILIGYPASQVVHTYVNKRTQLL